MTINIAEITTRHAAAMGGLNAQLGYPCSEDQVRLRIEAVQRSDDDVVYGAFTGGGDLIGWIHVFQTRRIETDSFCEIGGLVVDERLRGRQIGQSLVAEALMWCRQKGCGTLRVRSNIIREDAHRFYLKNGFLLHKQQAVFSYTL